MEFKKFNFKKVKSTNDTAIRIIKNTNFKFGMVISDTQLSGKGQYGNKWISYKGNLFVSFFHELKNINTSLSTLTKINCLLVKKILIKYSKKKIVFKKPNDLFIDKKKVSGILQEIISISDKSFLIIGIGVNLIKSPKIKNYPTTNLYELTDKLVNKKNFENDLKEAFEKNLSKMYKTVNKRN
jgi:BirA family biotin operon repressor/biotin-[acetyl-CoA-carboxylase] ligase